MFISGLTILFLCLAAVCKAIADTLTHHYATSVFRWKDPKFWDPSVSWYSAPFVRFTRYRFYGWHLANSGMIISFCLAASLHTAVLSWYYELPIAGIIFNLTFNLFYNKILRKNHG
jgi:hypothetical protein